jgi:hypothetical protein
MCLRAPTELVTKPAAPRAEPLTELDAARSLAVSRSNDLRSSVREVFEYLTTVGLSKGIALLDFGSLRRNEITQGSGDIDLLLIAETPYALHGFRKRFDPLLTKWGLKLDVPFWGTLDQIAALARGGLTERAIVRDASFICGDDGVAQHFYTTVQDTFEARPLIENIIFQTFLLIRGSADRERTPIKDLKYGAGGIRSRLTLHCSADLQRGYRDVQDDRMKIERTLDTLEVGGVLSSEDAEKAKSAAATLLVAKSGASISDNQLAAAHLRIVSARETSWNALGDGIGYLYGSPSRDLLNALRRAPWDTELQRECMTNHDPLIQAAGVMMTTDAANIAEVARIGLESGSWSILAACARNPTQNLRHSRLLEN